MQALLSAARKLSSVAVPYTTPAAAVEEDSPDPGAAEPAQDMPAARRRTYRSEVTFKRPSVIALSACAYCLTSKLYGKVEDLSSVVQAFKAAEA